MSTPKRATVHLEPEVYEALRARAESTHGSLSDLVNALVRSALAQEGGELSPPERHKKIGGASFDRLAQALKRRRQVRHRGKSARS